MTSDPSRAVRDAIQKLEMAPAGCFVVGEADPPRVVLVVKSGAREPVNVMAMTPHTAVALADQLTRAAAAALEAVYYFDREPFVRVMHVSDDAGNVNEIVAKMIAAGCTHAGICAITVTTSDPIPPFVTRIVSDGVVVATPPIVAGQQWRVGDGEADILVPLDKRFTLELSLEQPHAHNVDVDVNVVLDAWGYRRLEARTL